MVTVLDETLELYEALQTQLEGLKDAHSDNAPVARQLAIAITNIESSCLRYKEAMRFVERQRYYGILKNDRNADNSG